MSEKGISKLDKEEKDLSLQLDRATQTKTKICYYLDLSKNEREKHQLSKSERLFLRKKRYNLSTESERCILEAHLECKSKRKSI